MWLVCSGNLLQTLPALPDSLVVLNCHGNQLPLFDLERWRQLQTVRQAIHLREFQRRCRRDHIRRRVRTKDEINYAIHGRPGLGAGWFEFCAVVKMDPFDYDHAKYDLKRIKSS